MIPKTMLTRLAQVELTIAAAGWAAACADIARMPPGDVPPFASAAEAAWVDEYLDGLTEAEVDILGEPDNFQRYPPHPVSERMLTAWHAWREAHASERSLR